MSWWVSQELHDAASGMLIQGRDHQEVPGVVLRDSTQVEKRFNMLEPRSRVALPELG